MTVTDSPTETATAPQTIALEILTDEELSVLVPEQGVVVSPVLAEVPDAERDVVRRTAFRSLVARGIVDPPESDAAPTDTTAGGDVAVDLRVRTDVLSALTLRQSAAAVLAVARTTATGQDYWYAHVVEEILLLEEVGSNGLHSFALGHTRDLADLLVSAAVHPDAADSDAEPVELAVAPDSEAPAELLEQLGAAYVRADVVLLRRTPGSTSEQPEMAGLFTGPTGSWSIVAKPGSQRAWAHSETRASVTARARALAAAATEGASS